MGKYAANTSVSSELSRLEIEKTLIRYGADNFAYAASNGKALIGFTMYDRQIKFVLTLPCKEEFSKTPTGRGRSKNSQYEAWEQACRQRRCTVYDATTEIDDLVKEMTEVQG